MKRILFATTLCALSTGAHAIYGHAQLNASTFDWVGGVGGVGSGTVISPHFVLTAKHVGGMTFSLNGNTYNAINRFDNPTADISLLEFSSPFSKYSLPYFNSVMGQVLTFVGFGDTATERTTGAQAWTGYNYIGNAGTRRAVTNRIENQEVVDYDVNGVTNHTMSLEADLDFYDARTPAANQVDTLGGGGAVANEGGLLFGDSGGGSLIQINGEWRIAGVNAWIADVVGPNHSGGVLANDFLDYGDAFGVVSVQEYQNWILDIAPEAAPVPEPASMAALGLGALALLRKRKKS